MVLDVFAGRFAVLFRHYAFNSSLSLLSAARRDHAAEYRHLRGDEAAENRRAPVAARPKIAANSTRSAANLPISPIQTDRSKRVRARARAPLQQPRGQKPLGITRLRHRATRHPGHLPCRAHNPRLSTGSPGLPEQRQRTTRLSS